LLQFKANVILIMVNRNLFLADSATAAIESDKPRQRWAGARLAPAYPATVGIFRRERGIKRRPLA
jgi:hypothetical protein